jgi:hypothetical protein
MIGNLKYQLVKYIVEYLLKAKTVEKQRLLCIDCERVIIPNPFLGNGSQNTFPNK